MHMLRVIFFFILILCVGGAMAGNPIVWPKLKDSKFISGRAATDKDVSDDRAVFVLKSNGTPIGKPLAISLPQYAIHVDGDTKQRTPCVLIQAEQAGDNKFAGCRIVVDGSYLAGFLNEFELLGNNAPK